MERVTVNAAPAFQFYAKDFMSATMTMSAATVGAYIRLLAWSWDNGPVPLDDEERLRIMGTGLDSWTRLAGKWTRTEGGYVNERLETEREKQRVYREHQSVKGKQSSANRKATEAQQEGNRKSTEPPTGRQPDTQPEGNLSSSSSSSLSDLRSSSSPAETRTERAEETRAPVEAAGSLGTMRTVPRPAVSRSPIAAGSSGHRGCWPAAAACARGVCIPHFLGEQWLSQCAGNGAPIAQFVTGVVAGLPPGPIGDDPLRFWRAAWNSRHGSQAPAAPSMTTKGNASVAAMQRVLAKRQADREAAK